jgi:futalosine hydrolase
MHLLVVVAVAAERDAILAAAPQADVLVAGVGPVEAAAATTLALSRASIDLVISAGIGGGFAPLGIGKVAVASTITFADLGAETAEGFLPVSSLGFGSERYEVPARLAIELADLTGGHLGSILTVATVTGTAHRAAGLLAGHPDAVAEAMEGAGVAAAARLCGVPVAEVRAISNLVGPRDRGAWRIPEALAALGTALASILAAELTS